MASMLVDMDEMDYEEIAIDSNKVDLVATMSQVILDLFKSSVENLIFLKNESEAKF